MARKVIVAGSGNAALCAGIAALEAGADVLMLEKAGPETGWRQHQIHRRRNAVLLWRQGRPHAAARQSGRQTFAAMRLRRL